MKLRKYYPTIVLSDIHLGSEHSRTEEVTNFLKHVNCGRLILNGDIIDGWQLRKSGRRWKQQHTDFFKVLMKMMEKQGTEIIYVRGNHDDSGQPGSVYLFQPLYRERLYSEYAREALSGDTWGYLRYGYDEYALVGDVGRYGLYFPVVAEPYIQPA